MPRPELVQVVVGSGISCVGCCPAEGASDFPVRKLRECSLEGFDNGLQCRPEGLVVGRGPNFPVVGHAGVKLKEIHEVVHFPAPLKEPDGERVAGCEGGDLAGG